MTTEQHQEDFIAVFTHVITTPFGSEIEQSFACQLLIVQSLCDVRLHPCGNCTGNCPVNSQQVDSVSFLLPYSIQAAP